MRWIGAFLIFLSIWGRAQTDSLTFAEQLAELELSIDSISLIGFLDSLVNATPPRSEMSVRFGYSSSRLSAGRDFNVELRGYMPGLAYYHKSGLYADWVTYLDPMFSPAAYQSILHGGYMWLPHRRWTINPYAEKVFNHQSGTSGLLTHSVGTSVSFDFDLAEMSLDYAVLGGNGTGHRLIPSISKPVRLQNVPWVKTIKLYPGVSLLAGTTDIFTYQYAPKQVGELFLWIVNLSDADIRQLRIDGKITTAQAIQLRVSRAVLREGNPEDLEYLRSLYNDLKQSRAFQLLNINFSLPIMFTIGRTDIMVSYSYSIPQRVTGEDLDIDPTGFFGFTISRRFGF